jgi:hypothetical protein
VTFLDQYSDDELTTILFNYASYFGLRFIAHWDDGEWHTLMMDGDDPVASAFGGNPREANEALLRLLGLGYGPQGGNGPSPG